jgi:hypothetical protein
MKTAGVKEAEDMAGIGVMKSITGTENDVRKETGASRPEYDVFAERHLRSVTYFGIQPSPRACRLWT